MAGWDTINVNLERMGQKKNRYEALLHLSLSDTPQELGRAHATENYSCFFFP
ncbi:hypothetical protein FRC0182_01031 [Corynebacterium diphtheriae]|nr:hypothetical protein FRC0182_01031 [Corynebacterium diphtheriae]